MKLQMSNKPRYVGKNWSRKQFNLTFRNETMQFRVYTEFDSGATRDSIHRVDFTVEQIRELACYFNGLAAITYED